MSHMIGLWTHPRSVSTAFERMIMERGDHKVFHEPFAYLYFMHEARERIVHRRDNLHPETYEEIRKMLLEETLKEPVFHKDMAYHCDEWVAHDKVFLQSQINVFLIRDPWKAIPSHHKVRPEFSLRAAGYEALYKLFNVVGDLTGSTPLVIDADDLVTNAKAVIEDFCLRTGIDYKPDALNWKPGTPKEWETWPSWHTNASRSSGLHTSISQAPLRTEDPRLLAYIHHHLPFYEKLKKASLNIRGVAA